jgi:hypothetical protein
VQNDFRPGNGQFVTFPAHGFDQDRQVQLAAPRYLEPLRVSVSSTRRATLWLASASGVRAVAGWSGTCLAAGKG